MFIDGKSWPTTEHYFQAQKFIGTPYCEKIRKLPNPRDAFQLSRDPQVSRWRRADWENVKDDVMLKALRVKFSEDMRLCKLLRDTGEKELIEHTSNDSYWGDGGNGTGQNKLGQLLMKVRTELRCKYGSTTSITRDDSSVMPQRMAASSIPPSHQLKRSSSMSSLAGHSSYSPVPVTGLGTNRPSSRPPGTGGSHKGLADHHSYSTAGSGVGTSRQRSRSHSTGGSHSGSTISNIVQSGANLVESGAKKGAKLAKKVVTHPTSGPQRSTSRRGNASSVDYNIISYKHRQV